MAAVLPPLDGRWIDQKIFELSTFSDVLGEMNRLTLSPAHRNAAREMTRWFAAAGMETHIDATGTLIGRYDADRPGARTLLIGSHIDTVRNAGIYDGALGVLTGLSVVTQLQATRRRLPFAIDLVAFGDEEGVRFASTLTGSRALAGKFDPLTLEDTDADGISRRQALRDFGALPASVKACDPARTIGYVEVHIEQGPVLESHNLPLGIVTAINGTTRGEIRVQGTAGHAGTLPMAMRHDALAGAAEMMLAIEARAAGEPDLVATAGRISVPGAAVNVVPGFCAFSLDLRAPDDGARQKALADIGAAIAAIAARRGLEAVLEITHEADATQCDQGLSALMARALVRRSLPDFRLPSGAGHDAMAFRGVLPVAMLFVRCKGGISHNPAEYAKPEDMGHAARALFDFVTALAEQEA